MGEAGKDELFEALKPVRDMLEADGYELVIANFDNAEAAVTLEVVAGPEACADCLVPTEVFRNVVGQYLPATITKEQLEIVYPASAAH